MYGTPSLGPSRTSCQGTRDPSMRCHSIHSNRSSPPAPLIEPSSLERSQKLERWKDALVRPQFPFPFCKALSTPLPLTPSRPLQCSRSMWGWKDFWAFPLAKRTLCAQCEPFSPFCHSLRCPLAATRSSSLSRRGLFAFGDNSSGELGLIDKEPRTLPPPPA